MFIPWSSTYFLEVGACLLLKLATKASLRGKKLLKFRYSGYFSKAKMKECNQKNWSFSNKFGMLMPGSEISFLKKRAHVSLKVAAKVSFLDKKVWKFNTFKAFFLKQEWRRATKKIEISLTNLECWCLVQKQFSGKECTCFTESSRQRFFFR